MPLSISDVLGQAKRPVRSVRVCLDGELWARHDELSQEIDRLQQQSRGKMGDVPEATALSQELREVEAAMRAAEVEFKFQGISLYKRDEIIAKYPSKDGRGWDTTAGAHELLSAAAVEPAMTEAEARQLVEAVHSGAAQKLFSCAWAATESSADVPFFARASA